ncbi:hypothetical protein [Hyphococcus luteus]|uniref:Uncharacterized protein n=1 Tax=Hyphococcus luteus TaxID=2058213 RepID=A0A2S7K5Q5_9PROT|nr:hypothetical protein [Marinicaulis flavus]PQA87806.1 hypothetical protein CW354_05480 [Marinicaulis flavus]
MNLMKLIRALLGTGAALMLSACGGPVPSDMFLTLSVSTRDVAVKTAINGKPSDFLSGGEEGSMTASAPLNNTVKEGENEATFLLSGRDHGDDGVIDAAFLATLEIAVKGEIVDTLEPGERMIFSRELTEEEAAALAGGESVTITERFTVSRAALEEMKAGE